MRQLLTFILLVGLCLLPGHVVSAGAWTAGGDEQTRFLDLPDGFGWSEDEEDEPEIIEFYDDQYEGDGFFFCLDRSSSMGQPASNGMRKFDVLKKETVEAISGLTNRSVVSVVFYDYRPTPLVYGDPPMRMDGAGKARIISQVMSTQISHGSCLLRGALKCLELAGKTQNEHRTMILIADGRTTCPNGERDPNRIFQQIMSRNTLRIPINTIYTGPQSGSDWTEGKPLLERLARATNGKFKIAR